MHAIPSAPAIGHHQTVAIDAKIRASAFNFLAEQVRLHGDVLPWGLLKGGFRYEGKIVPLIGQRGIWKPKILSDVPISISSTLRGPYEDGSSEEGFILYRYQGTDPTSFDNVWLRNAMERRTPLIYFEGIIRGQYAAAWPAFVIHDDPGNLTFTVAVDDAVSINQASSENPVLIDTRRQYVTSLTKRRLHQAGFRGRVISAYKSRCAICTLRHPELLDAAHIRPYGEGAHQVPNGLSLCKLHHAAFDQNIVGVRPDLQVEINQKILEEVDGPMLVHGLQGFHGKQLHVPTAPANRPNRDFLEERYELFRSAI